MQHMSCMCLNTSFNFHSLLQGHGPRDSFVKEEDWTFPYGSEPQYTVGYRLHVRACVRACVRAYVKTAGEPVT